MNHILKVIFGTYYYIDDSVERVQDTTIKDLTYVMMGDDRNPSYQEQQEKRLDIMLEQMEKSGLPINENLLDALENNSYIENVKWNLQEKIYGGLDEVILTFDLVDGNFKAPIKITFVVTPKPSALTFLSHPDIARLYTLLSVEITANGKTAKFTGSRAYETLVTFYSNSECRNLFKAWKKH